MSAFHRLQTLTKEPLSEVVALCGSIIDKTEVPLIRQICHHIITSRAKSIRPMVTLAIAMAVGVDPKTKIRTAACIELIHTATLLHDDVLDGGIFRRGKTTVNKLWGNRQSILIGDFLLSRAFHLVVDQPRVADLLAKVAARLVEGEIMQLEAVGNLGISHQRYFAIISAKTACLFAAAARLGATAETAKTLEEYGNHLGIAFQCGDDVLDYKKSSVASGGKNTGQDFKEAKITLPLLNAAQTINTKGFWQKLLTDPTNFSEAKALMEQNQIFAKCFDQGEEFVAKARDALKPLPAGEAKQVLWDLPMFALKRQ